VRHWVGATLTTACVILATACGTPSYHYVKNSEERLYFKVPRQWERVDQQSLDRFELQGVDEDSRAARLVDELTWSIAYEDSDEPSPTHLLGGVEDPIAYARVQRLLEPQRGTVSFDWLRNLVLPVTESAREQAKAQEALPPGFELIEDEVLTPGHGLRGVHVVFNYSLGGALQTFDQTAYVNDDASRAYLLLVRCTADCYRDRGPELREVVGSFTVRESR
jgi:hypothetical protein